MVLIASKDLDLQISLVSLGIALGLYENFTSSGLSKATIIGFEQAAVVTSTVGLREE